LSDSGFEPFTNDDVQSNSDDEDITMVKENVRNEKVRRQKQPQIEKVVGCHEEAGRSGKGGFIEELGINMRIRMRL